MMKDRIKAIRKHYNLTQTEFGDRIGVKGNTITNYENDLRNPSDAIIVSICREFNVNEDWLRSGTGEMFKSRTREQEIGAFVNDVMELNDDSFEKKLVSALARLEPKDWECLETIAKKLLDDK